MYTKILKLEFFEGFSKHNFSGNVRKIGREAEEMNNQNLAF